MGTLRNRSVKFGVAFRSCAAVLTCAALVTAAMAQTRPPAPGARPAAPASRPAGSTRPSRTLTDPAPPPPPPPVDEPRAPATAPGGGWYAAANLRLDALQTAASEVPLDPAVRIHVTDRIARARAEVNAAAAKGETPAGKQSADAALARLDQDVQATAAKDAGPRLLARAGQILGEVRELSRANTSTFATMFEVLTRPTTEQQAKIRQILGDAGRKVEQIELGPRDGLDQRRFAVGFATRAALRGVLTPEQVKNWDELSAPRPGGDGIALTSRPAAPDYVAEIEANYSTRLEAMRLALEEGPHKPDVKKKALARVQKLKEEIAAAAAEPVKPRGEMTADKIDRLRLQCARDLNDILGGGGYKDFDERVQRILGQVLMLHNPDRPLTSGFLGDTLADLGLTPEQKARIDQLLKQRVDKLKQADQASAGQPTSIQRMRQDEVAFATRAAIRQTLTPKQLKMWDQGT